MHLDTDAAKRVYSKGNLLVITD